MGATTIEKILARTSGKDVMRPGEIATCSPDLVIHLERPATPANPDADADYLDVRTIDLGDVEPYLILPDSIPKNGVRLSAFKQNVKIDQAFIGSCAGGLIEDLRVAARIMRGRQVAPGVRFIVTPGSQAIYLQAVREGLIETLVAAGASGNSATRSTPI